MRNRSGKHWLHLAGLIAVLVAMFAASSLLPRDRVQDWVLSAGAWGPLVYVFLMLITYVIAPASGTPVLFVGFYMFGSAAILYAAIAEMVSIVTNFWIARKWGRGVVERFVGHRGMEKIDRIDRDYGLGMLWVARVFLGSVHEFVSYAAGFTTIRFRRYFIVSLFGMIPGTMIWYYFSSLTQSPVVFTLITFALVLVFSIVVYVWKKFFFRSGV